MLIDYYQVLEVPRIASLAAIKAAYRRLAMLYHPDKNKALDASQKFIEITEAYEVLGDYEKRAVYDSLYTRYFSNHQIGATAEPAYQKQQRSWAEYGRKKAKEYASMNYDEFVQRAFNEIKVGAKYIPNLIFIFFCLLGFIGILKVVPKAFSDDSAPQGAGFAFILVAIGFMVLGVFLFKRMKSDYLRERTRSFKK